MNISPEGANGPADRATAKAALLDDEHPWPGLAAYTEASRDFFHGRGREAAELLRLIRLAPLTALYGRSGLGKSSLLQAGLFPLLRAQHYLPVYVHVDFSEAAKNAPLEQVALRLEEELAHSGAECPERARDEGLWEYLHREDLAMWSSDNYPLTPVLVLDQFEELFSRSGSRGDRIQQVLNSFADLIENRIPSELAGEADRAKLSRIDLLSQRYCVVLSFREDFLPEVKAWEKDVPSLLRKYLRLGQMTQQCADEAVQLAGRAVLDEGAAPMIVDFVGRPEAGAAETDASDPAIEPVLLSLFCTQLNRRRPVGGKIDASLIRSAGQDILDSFYREALDDPEVKGPPDVADFVETYLVQGERFRGDFPKDEALKKKLLTKTQLEALTDRHRLLRVVPYADTARIELIHDRLVPVVCKARDERALKEQRAEQERQAKLAKAELDKERARREELQRERDKARRNSKRAYAAFALCLLLASYAWWQSDRAQSERQNAEKLLGFLLGETFLGEVRDVGRSTILEQVRGEVEEYVGRRDASRLLFELLALVSTDDPRTALNLGLAHRNYGDVELTDGNLSESVKFLERALKFFVSSPDDLVNSREAARTRERIGEVLSAQGKVTEALFHYKEALKAWRQVVARDTNSIADCTSLADSLVSAGSLKLRMGEATLARTDLEEALKIVTAVLVGRQTLHDKCGPVAGKAEPPMFFTPSSSYPDAKALEVFSNAVILRAAILNFREDYEGAPALAMEARRLRPISASARKNAFVALIWRGDGRIYDQPQSALVDYRKALAGFEELRRWDPDNRIWQRERAANQLRVSGGIVACRESKTKDCTPMPSLAEAEASALEAIATLRALAGIDPTNFSLQMDLGWGLQEHARVLASQDRKAERLARLEESEKVYINSIPDPTDAGSAEALGLLLLNKIDALAVLDRQAEAKATLQKTIDLFNGLIAAHQDNSTYVADLSAVRQREAEILRKTGDRAGADAADREVTRLNERYQETIESNSQKAEKQHYLHIPHQNEGVTLFNEGDHTAALGKFKEAESSLWEYIWLQPTDFEAYDELRNIYRWIQLTQKELGNAEEGTAAVRASMYAAQLAALLAPEDNKMINNMLAARHNLAVFLYDNKRFDEALAMVQEEVVIAEALVQGTKSADLAVHLWRLGDAKQGLSVMRRDLEKAGWEEAMWSGLIDFQRAAEIDTKNPDYQIEIGISRKYLAEQLDGDGLKEKALVEYRLALEAYQKALNTYQKAASISPADKEAGVHKAEDAIRELAERAVR